jgi:hypothetical protein
MAFLCLAGVTGVNYAPVSPKLINYTLAHHHTGALTLRVEPFLLKGQPQREGARAQSPGFGRNSALGIQNANPVGRSPSLVGCVFQFSPTGCPVIPSLLRGDKEVPYPLTPAIFRHRQPSKIQTAHASTVAA